MATDFTNNNTTIDASGGVKPKTRNTPLDIRTRVNLKADIDSIPNPFVGMKILVLQDETNNNEMTEYVVVSLKANNLGVADSKVNEVVLAKDFLGVSANGISEEQAQQLNTAYTHSQSVHVQASDIPTKTSELNNDSDYVNSTYVTNKIAEASLSGGEVDLSGYVTKETGNANQITFSDGQTFQAKLDAGTLKGDKGDTGEQGPQGPKGETGEAADITVNDVTVTSIDFSTSQENIIYIPDRLQLKNNSLQLMCGTNTIGNSVTLPTSSSEGGSTSTSEWTKVYEITTTEEMALIGVEGINATEFKMRISHPAYDASNYGYIQVNGVDSGFVPAFVNNYNVLSGVKYDALLELCEYYQYGTAWQPPVSKFAKKWWEDDTINSVKIKAYSATTFKVGTTVAIYTK